MQLAVPGGGGGVSGGNGVVVGVSGGNGVVVVVSVVATVW
jgi:hypothetical protein